MVDKQIESCQSGSTVVLLSGGLDSTAALLWARETDPETIALSIDYGQANVRRELPAAGRICKTLGVKWTRLCVAEAVRGLGLLQAAPAGVDDNGVSKANLPARNMIFLSIAAAEAFRACNVPSVRLVIGCNGNDAAAFPDCRFAFIKAAETTLTMAADGFGRVTIETPWLLSQKSEIVRWMLDRGHRCILDQTISCYDGTDCGSCDACTLRERAIRDA